MAQLAKIKHLLVDLDGTLVHYKDLPVQFDFIVRSLGALQKHASLIRSIRALRATHKALRKANPAKVTNDIRAVEAFSRKLNVTAEKGRRIFQECLTLLFPGLKKHFKPAPGAKEFLGWARRRYQLTLATNPVWPVELIKLRVQWAGLDPSIFEWITDATHMHSVKPDPEYYREILSELKAKPEECLLIGNEVEMDLPATKLGISVFLVESGRKRLKTLPSRANRGRAWKGRFEHLKALLESEAG